MTHDENTTTVRAIGTLIAAQVDLRTHTVVRRCLITGRLDPSAENYVLEIVPRNSEEQRK